MGLRNWDNRFVQACNANKQVPPAHRLERNASISPMSFRRRLLEHESPRQAPTTTFAYPPEPGPTRDLRKVRLQVTLQANYASLWAPSALSRACGRNGPLCESRVSRESRAHAPAMYSRSVRPTSQLPKQSETRRTTRPHPCEAI